MATSTSSVSGTRNGKGPHKRGGLGKSTSHVPGRSNRPARLTKDADRSSDSRDSIAAAAKTLGSTAMRSAENLLSSEVIRRTGESAQGLSSIAQALRSTSEDLQDSFVGEYVEKAAEQMDRVSDYLRTANVKKVARSVEDFAKREPLLFLGGAFAVGLVGTRLIMGATKGRAERAAEVNGRSKGHGKSKGAARS